MTSSKPVNLYNSEQISLNVAKYYFQFELLLFRRHLELSHRRWWRHMHDDVIFNLLFWLLFVIFVAEIWYISQNFRILQYYFHFIIQQLIKMNIFLCKRSLFREEKEMFLNYFECRNVFELFRIIAVYFEKKNRRKRNVFELWHHQWCDDDAMHLSVNKIFYSSWRWALIMNTQYNE